MPTLTLPDSPTITVRRTGTNDDVLQLLVKVPVLIKTEDAASQERAIIDGLTHMDRLVKWFADNVSVLNREIASSG
jgi:hypothetical protein